MVSEKIGNKISVLRRAKGINQKEFAGEIGVSQPSLIKFEKGETDIIPLGVAKKLAQKLGVSFNELFEIEANNANLDRYEELLRAQLEEFEQKVLYQEKMIERYEKQVDFLSGYFSAYKALILAGQEIVLDVILSYENYLREANIPKLIPIGLVSSKVRKDAIRLLKKQFVVDEEEFEKTYQQLQQKIDELK